MRTIIDLLVESPFCASRAEAQRLLIFGTVRINGVPVQNPEIGVFTGNDVTIGKHIKFTVDPPTGA